MVNVMRVGGGAPEAIEAAQLLAMSDAVVPGVLSCEAPRRGAAAQGLRVEGVPAALVPLEGVAPHVAIGLALQGGEPERTPLDAA
eukprot:1195818-Pleurochrysis_carterae.AAC.1